MDWKAILAGLIGAMITLFLKGIGYGFSVRQDVNSLKQSLDEFKTTTNATLTQHGAELHELRSKIDSLSVGVGRIEGILTPSPTLPPRHE